MLNRMTWGARPPLRFSLRAHGPGIARLVWAAVVLLTLSVFFATVPARLLYLEFQSEQNLRYLGLMGLSVTFLRNYFILFDTLAIVIFCGIAAVIAWSKSDDWSALFASATLLLLGVLLTRPVNALAFAPPGLHAPVAVFLSLGFSAVVLFTFVFPDGRFVPRWVRWPALGWVMYAVALYALPLLFLRAPVWPPRLQPGWVAVSWIASGLAVQIYRYRTVATAVQRQQSKWVVVGLSASAAGFLGYVYLAPTLLPNLREPGVARVVYLLLGVPSLYVTILFLPLAVTFSVLRYRLWDVGVFVNRTIVYGVLTLLLLLMYVAIVLALQLVFPSLTGQRSPLVMAVSTLATAALFFPLQQRVRAGINRRLFREKYNAAQTLTALSLAMRDEVDRSRLVVLGETAVAATLRPSTLLTWLCEAERCVLCLPDPLLADPPAGASLGDIPRDDDLIQWLEAGPDVVSLDRIALGSPARQRLETAGVVLLTVVRAHGQLVGWLSLGPRLSGQGYSADDAAFLGAVATQLGPALRVAQLAEMNQAAALERQRLAQQLHVARLVQQTLLPQRMPELPGWRLAAHYQPAQAVGGDFYDLLLFKDGRLGLIIGDVSDKGIPAALVMAATRSLLRSVAHELRAPGAVLQRANALLLPDLPPGIFVTCLYLILDPASGEIVLANAGHNPPCWRTAGVVQDVWVRGMPLGWLPDAIYEEAAVRLEPGDCMLLYSDGLTEAGNERREIFGAPRLRARLAQIHSGGMELVNDLLQALADYRQSAVLEDDVTIVTLERERLVETVERSTSDARPSGE